MLREKMKNKLAHVDLDTGKIFGCKKGSMKWWHEKGHIKFNNSEFGSKLGLVRGYLFNIWIFFIMLALRIKSCFWVALVVFMFYLSLVLFEEWWCNQYAIRNCKK